MRMIINELRRKMLLAIIITWKRIVVGEIDFEARDGKRVSYTIAEIIFLEGTEYALFVAVHDRENFLIQKSEIDVELGECWRCLDTKWECWWAFQNFRFSKSFYPELVKYGEELVAMNIKEYFEDEIREDYQKLTAILIEKKLTITTMESATAGQIASLITDSEGSSAVFPGAYIAYSNQEKIRLGVPAEVIERFSVYSKEVAEEMAKVCEQAFQSDIGIGVTGTMGNVDSANPGNSLPGKVYFAICLKSKMYSFSVEIPHQESRLMYKLAVAKEVYDRLMELFIAAKLVADR